MSTPETPKKVPQFSALKLNPVPSKDDCCCEGACETQTQTLPESGNRYSWVVNGMDCAACARKVENAVKQVPGVSHVQVLFATEKLLVSADNDVSKQVEDAVNKAGYSLRSEAAPAEKASSLKENLPLITLIIMMALSWGLEQINHPFGNLAFIATTLVGLFPIARQALRLMKSGSWFAIETLMSVAAIGAPAIGIDAAVVAGTLLLGVLLGRALKMDRDLALLTSTGSAICGAAAVLGAEPVVKAAPHKTAVAVSTVVIFGTVSMFLYPALWRAGILGLTPEQMGLYTGATLHEVAHVVGAGNAMGAEIADGAVIVKMIRVMMLAPVLLVMSLLLTRRTKGGAGRAKVTIPWFAFGFLAVIGFNSLDLLPEAAVAGINSFDTFLLTMAMTALGAETSIEKFKRAGAKPFLLAGLLYLWLLGGGYLLSRWIL